MAVAPAGMATFAPTAVITPLSKTIVPFGIGAEVTGTMVALRMANAGFLPGLFMITDCPKRLPAKNAQVRAMVRLLILVLRLLRVLLLLCLVVRFLLQAVHLLLRQVLAKLQVALAIEDHLALHERGVDAGVGREGVAGPDGEVGVLAGVDGADAVIEPELFGRIHRAELERFILGKSAVLHRLRREIGRASCRERV